jgi:hypothetical protein
MSNVAVIPAEAIDPAAVRTGRVLTIARAESRYNSFHGRQQWYLEMSDGGRGILWWSTDKDLPTVGDQYNYQRRLDKKGAVLIHKLVKQNA